MSGSVAVARASPSMSVQHLKRMSKDLTDLLEAPPPDVDDLRLSALLGCVSNLTVFVFIEEVSVYFVDVPTAIGSSCAGLEGVLDDSCVAPTV